MKRWKNSKKTVKTSHIVNRFVLKKSESILTGIGSLGFGPSKTKDLRQLSFLPMAPIWAVQPIRKGIRALWDSGKWLRLFKELVHLEIT